jgi:hypothetical protein
MVGLLLVLYNVAFSNADTRLQISFATLNVVPACHVSVSSLQVINEHGADRLVIPAYFLTIHECKLLGSPPQSLPVTAAYCSIL